MLVVIVDFLHNFGGSSEQLRYYLMYKPVRQSLLVPVNDGSLLVVTKDVYSWVASALTCTKPRPNIVLFIYGCLADPNDHKLIYLEESSESSWLPAWE